MRLITIIIIIVQTTEEIYGQFFGQTDKVASIRTRCGFNKGI